MRKAAGKLPPEKDESGENAMIAYIRGEVAEILENRVVLDVNGMGYQVFVSSKEIQAMPGSGETVKLHTYFHVKEDAMQLYGFLTRDDCDIFKLLLGVNGIGPKAALGILSVLSADDLRFAVLSDDAKSIAKAPGVGNKTAQKLILELKDKLSLEDAFEKRLEHGEQEASVGVSGMTDHKSEAVQALVALGYSNSDALRAVKTAGATPEMDTEEILKAALKHMSFL